MIFCLLHVQLGKLRVYRSGKVKLQLGDVVFGMAQGIPSEARSLPTTRCFNTAAMLPALLQAYTVHRQYWRVHSLTASVIQ